MANVDDGNGGEECWQGEEAGEEEHVLEVRAPIRPSSPVCEAPGNDALRLVDEGQRQKDHPDEQKGLAQVSVEAEEEGPEAICLEHGADHSEPDQPISGELPGE